MFAYGQHRLFPGAFGDELRRESSEKEPSLRTVSGGLDWAGRPVFTGTWKGPESSVGNQSRFST